MVWLRPLALAAGALFLAGGLYGTVPLLSGGLVLVAVGASAWAFAVGVLPRLRPRDRYDLGELRRVHRAAEMLDLDDEGALDDLERVVCPHCFEEFPHRVRVCPRCGRGG